MEKVMDIISSMNIFQRVFCVLLAHRIFNCIEVLASLSYNLMQKVYKNCLLYRMKLKEKTNKMQFSRMTLITRVLIIVLPITSVILWLLVFYYSTFDDTKAAVLSYLGSTSIIFTTKYVFVENANLVSLKFLNYLAFFFIIAGCLLLLKFFTMAFYAVCLGILSNKMKYDVEQIRSDSFFEDTEVSHGNFADPQDLTDETMKEDSVTCFDDSENIKQNIGNTESIINDPVETDQSGATKEKEENILKFEKHVSENNFDEKSKETNQLHDDSNKSIKQILEGSFSEMVGSNFVFTFSKTYDQEFEDMDISDVSTKVSECRKTKFEEIGQNNDSKVKSLLTTDLSSNSFINSDECASKKARLRSLIKEVNEKLEGIFDRDLFVNLDESQSLVVQNKEQLDTDYQNENNKDTPKVYSGDKFWENIIFQNGEFQQKVSNKVEDVITSNTSRENNFNWISGKSKSLNSNESFTYNRQQMIDKICEDIKSKMECRNMQVQTDSDEEIDEFCRLVKHLSAPTCELIRVRNIPPCIIDKLDQLSPQCSADMIKTSPNKYSEQEGFNLLDFSTSNEQFESESKSSVKYTRMQKFGNDSTSTSSSLIEPEAKSTFTTDFECYSNSHVKQVTSLEKQSENENSDFVINEKIDESATIASANVRVTPCPSAISNAEGVVNTIDMSFIYAVGPSFPY